MSPPGTGVISVTVPVWSVGCGTVSPSLHGPRCHRCHRSCMVPGVWHGVTVTARPPGRHTVSPWLHSPTRVTQCYRAALRYCTASLLLPGCHMASLSPHGAQGVTVTAGPPAATQCHCSSRGLSHRVIISAWCMGCHIALCHCMAHGLSPSVTVTAVPQCITQCRCHCMAHRVSPSVAVTAWPGVSHTVTVQDTPPCHSPHIPWAVTQCHCAPPGCAAPHPHRPWGTLGTAQPSSPTPRYS